MTDHPGKPDDIPQDVWDRAFFWMDDFVLLSFLDGDEEGAAQQAIARAILDARASLPGIPAHPLGYEPDLGIKQSIWDAANSLWMNVLGRDGGPEMIARAIMAATLAEREACAEVVRQMIPAMPPDGPVSKEHQVEYETLGFAMTAIRKRGEG